MKKKVISFLSFIGASKIALIIFLEIIAGIFLSIFSFFLFFKIGKEVFENELYHFDYNISHFVYSLRSPFLTKIMFFVSSLGGDFIIIASSLLIIFLLIRKHKKESVLFLSILAMDFLINNLIKEIVKRPRPEIAPLVMESTYSFPSAHSMGSFAFYALISYFIYHFTKRKKLSAAVTFLSIILIALIGFSRIYLGVHYPSDVLAGFVGGFWIFITAIVIERTMLILKLFKESEK